jgi:hypothetical protein
MLSLQIGLPRSGVPFDAESGLQTLFAERGVDCRGRVCFQRGAPLYISVGLGEGIIQDSIETSSRIYRGFVSQNRAHCSFRAAGNS